MGGGATRTARTTLGQMNSKSQEGPAAKPAVRTTRTQQLRAAKITEQKKAEKSGKAAAKMAPPKPVVTRQASPEPMDVSMTDATQKELEQKIAQVELDDRAEDRNGGEFVDDCYAYLRYKEHQMATPPRFLDSHSEVTPKMRAILVDWLVQVHKRFRLQAETLYLTVSIMDHYLGEFPTVSKNDMQLIGVTAMMMACKYEEIYSPEMDDFVYMCDNAYNAEQLKEMELKMFEAIDYTMGFALSIQFLRRLSKTTQDALDAVQHSFAKYLLELSLMDYDLCSMKPSLIAAAALNLSVRILGTGKLSWSPVLEHYSEYTEVELDYTLNLICKALYQTEFTKSGTKLTAIKKKYADQKNFAVSGHEKVLSNKDMIYERARTAKEALQEKLKK